GLIFMARGYFLRLLQGFLGLHGHFVKTQHGSLSTLKKGGWPGRQPPMLAHGVFRRWHLFADYRPAAAAAATPSTFTLICLGLASSRFGTLSVSTPYLYSALIASVFTVFARAKLRLKLP